MASEMKKNHENELDGHQNPELLQSQQGGEKVSLKAREWFLRVMVGWFNQSLRFALLLPKQAETPQEAKTEINEEQEMEIHTDTSQLRHTFFALPLLFDALDDEESDWLRRICEEAAPFSVDEHAKPKQVIIYPRLSVFKAGNEELRSLGELFEKSLESFTVDQLQRMQAKIKPFQELEHAEDQQIDLDTICLLVGLISALQKAVLGKISQAVSSRESSGPLQVIRAAAEAPPFAVPKNLGEQVAKKIKALLREVPLRERQTQSGHPIQLEARSPQEKAFNDAYSILRPSGMQIIDGFNEFHIWAKIRDSRNPGQSLVEIFAETRLADLAKLPEQISAPLRCLVPFFQLLDVTTTDMLSATMSTEEKLTSLMKKTILAMKPFKSASYYTHPHDYLETEEDGREVSHEELWWVYFQIRTIFQEERGAEKMTQEREKVGDEEGQGGHLKANLANKTLQDVLERLFPGVDQRYLLQPETDGQVLQKSPIQRYFQERFQRWAAVSAAYFGSIDRPDIALVMQSFFDGLANDSEQTWKTCRLFEHLQNVALGLKEEEFEGHIRDALEGTWGKLASTTGAEIFEHPEKAEEIAILLEPMRELERGARSAALVRVINRDRRFLTIPGRVVRGVEQDPLQLIGQHPGLRVLLENEVGLDLVIFDMAMRA